MTAGRRGRSARGQVIHRAGRDWVTAEAARALLGDDITKHILYDWWRRGLVQKISDGRTALYLWSQVEATDTSTRLSKTGRKRAAGDRDAAQAASGPQP